jgi:uncharacterized protein YaeQ
MALGATVYNFAIDLADNDRRVSDPGEPAIAVRDLTGAMKTWNR